jgi:hypothetical protein
MRTTLLNPAVYLLAAIAIAGVVGACRRWQARQTLETVVRYACAWPVLLALVVMAGAGAGSRAVLGFLAPGAYAEEVIAARSFIDTGRLYATDARQELARWMAESQAPPVPWAELPGISGCEVSAITDRAALFRSSAHMPPLLLAGVPFVGLGGGHALYVTLLILSLISIAVIVWVLLECSAIDWRSRRALLVLAAVAGWQPVLAAIRQGDAILPVAALILLAWHLSTRLGPSRGAAVAAGVASWFALPGILVLPALFRVSRTSGLLAVLLSATGVALTLLAAGTGVISSFGHTTLLAANTYAGLVANYAIFARGISFPAAYSVAALAAVLLFSWRRSYTANDAFSLWSMVGLMLAPVVWSQHLLLALLPAIVLLRRLLRTGSSGALAAWAVLILVLSLPDGSSVWLTETLRRAAGGALPVPALALVSLFSALLYTAEKVDAPAPSLEHAPGAEAIG